MTGFHFSAPLEGYLGDIPPVVEVGQQSAHVTLGDRHGPVPLTVRRTVVPAGGAMDVPEKLTSP